MAAEADGLEVPDSDLIRHARTADLVNVDVFVVEQVDLVQVPGFARVHLLTLPEDTFYIHELVGFTVFDESRNQVGKLKEIWQLPANDVYVVESDQKETLFPAIKGAIKKISTEDSEIIVDERYGVIQ